MTARWFSRFFRRPPPSRRESEQIGAWLSTSTYHHSDFADVAKLVAAKERQGLKVSLCLPALNEEKTIGKVVVLLKAALMTRHRLLDEIAVIDSGSTDRTREVAASYGAQVYLASEILPDLGQKKGKGENLWKAIYQLQGDILVFIDADITNIRPHFAYGLIGPLIERPEVQYVKAFYDRPLTVSKGVRVSGGGRVTEILVRPLFSLYFPELTALIQPLSGEYAARRSALEQIPFPIGYGVETAHLLDIHQRWGLQALAQTDLDQRVHRNQDTHALGRMAFGILQTFMNRMQAHGHIRQLPEARRLMRQFQLGEDGRYAQVEKQIVEDERPPMIEIPAYRQKFGRSP